MKNNNIMNYVRTPILCIILIISIGLIFNSVSGPTNAVQLAKTNLETIDSKLKPNTEEVPEFIIDFKLQDITIKEHEKYSINSFIKTEDKELLNDINYSFKEEKMDTYSTIGTHEIIIVFKDSYGQEIEKSASLVITPKAEVKTQTNNKITSTSTNTTKSTTKTKNTTNEPKKDIETLIKEENKKLGTYGRIYFSSLYSVALYRPTTSEQAQKMVDDKDSAAYYRYGKIMIIADHAHQGFTIIKSQKAGDYVYIKSLNEKNEYQISKYIIREVTTGKNTGVALTTDDGRDIGTDVNNDLALYTCNTSDGLKVTIVLLDKVQ